MKNIFIKTLLLASIALSITACSEKKSDEGKVRRFTFSVPSSQEQVSFIGEKVSVKTYQLKDRSFIIIDAPSDYDLAKTEKLLEEKNPSVLAMIKASKPLDRIYKMDQVKAYTATEGQLLNVQEDTKRYVWTLEIVNDATLREEYIDVHGIGKAWPEITNNMKQMGIKDMELYLEGYQAFLIMDTRKDFDLTKDGEKWSKLPRESEWQEYVAKFQKVDPLSKATEKWQTMHLLKNGTTIKFEENWESLSQYKIPQWMKDRKFGIFIHWGPNSVAELHTDWYPRWMYLDNGIMNPQTGEITKNKPHPAVAYHKKKFGDQKTFGYKDMIPMWTMEHFNAKAWVDLFKKSGAQYVVPVAEHHDSYALYESSITKYNSVNMGPKKDVFKELTDEIRKQGLISGASSHLAFNWNFYNQQSYFDTGNPEFSDIYAPPHKPDEPASEAWLANFWWPRTKEIIDKYQPDILWFDFFLDRPEFAPYHKKLAAYYYNSGLKRGKEVVLQTKNYKYESYPVGTHMLDLERSKLDSIRPEYWQTDTSIGKNSWYYAENWIPKSSGELIADLVDIVSKNGCLLLNIGPRKDGIIPDDQQKTLLDIGKWLDRNGEAIYSSNYWKIYGEGPTKTALGHLSESKNKGFTSEDIRFTTNNGNLYAFVLIPPTDTIKIRNLSVSNIAIKSIELLGYEGKVEYQQMTDHLEIEVPKKTDLEYTWVFKITSNDSL